MPEASPELSLDPLERLESLSTRGMKLGLDAIRALLGRLGNPERRTPRVLIAGTNGKGSTAATLSAIFNAAGVRAGLHTSPHLDSVCERVRVAEAQVPRTTLATALAEVFEAARRAPSIPITYFEAVTAAAEMIFARERCDVAVVEVGLGGRLDATNASEPALSLVTSIALDHTEDLGNSVESIAREKAGIFRRGIGAICRARDAAALQILRREARRVGADFRDAGSCVRVIRSTGDGFSQCFTLETGTATYDLETPLLGEHQRENISLAVLAAEALSARFGLSRASIERGVAQTFWPGRLEALRLGAKTVWLDGCHNPEGAGALARFLTDRSAEVELVFGAMADKDVAGMVASLAPRARRIIFAAPRSARAASPAELKARVPRLAVAVEEAPSVAAALDRALSSSGADVVAAGSLFLVAEARAHLRDLSMQQASA